MPATLLGSDYQSSQFFNVQERDISYSYPEGLDLRPSSELHKRIVAMVYDRALQSHSYIQQREPIWRKLERNLTSYVPLSDEERKVKTKDSRKPVSIVVPLSFATLETLLTYLVSTYVKDPVFNFKSNTVEDTLGTALLERVVQIQVKRNKLALSLYTQWRDALVYGFGAVAPKWQIDYGWKSVIPPETSFGPFAQFVEQEQQRLLVRDVVFEGNVIDNIDPYLYLPDVNVPLCFPQKGEYTGWVQRTNYHTLLNQERENSEDFFNAKYLEGLSGLSSLFLHSQQSGRIVTDPRRGANTFGKPQDVIWMNITLIPSVEGLGSSKYPEKWLFGVAADKFVIYAKQQKLEHGMFPVAVCSPDADGHSLFSTSRLEIVYGMQEFVDWSISSHIHNVRKSLNDMFIYDPMLVNPADMEETEPGKLIRTRRSAWGRGVEGGVKQFPVTDVTSSHVQALPLFMDLINRITGSADILQGVVRQGGERRSALEARDARASALSRLEKISNIGLLQSHYDIQRMLASHTQQFMSQEMLIGATGKLAEVLAYELGQDPTQASLRVNSEQLRVDWDYSPGANSATDPSFGQTFMQALQMSATNPEISARVDIVRLYLQAIRTMGIDNVEDYLRKGGQLPQADVKVMPDEQVADQARAGNLLPLSEASNVSASPYA